MREVPSTDLPILRLLGCEVAPLLGAGGESRVYALDEERILRVYNPDITPGFLKRRHALNERLLAARLPIETPHVFSFASDEGVCHTVEARMKGRDFSHVLPELTGNRRLMALESYMEVAEALSRVQMTGEAYGELVTDPPLRASRWTDFLLERTYATLTRSRPRLEADVPHLPEILAFYERQVGRLDPHPPPCLTHGDYYPANVFIGDDGLICGVGDFSYTSLVGEARMDLGGALAFIELTESYTPEDSRVCGAWVTRRYGKDIKALLHLYRLYYSFYFSYCYDSDPQAYRWVLANFHRHLENR